MWVNRAKYNTAVNNGKILKQQIKKLCEGMDKSNQFLCDLMSERYDLKCKITEMEDQIDRLNKLAINLLALVKYYDEN